MSFGQGRNRDNPRNSRRDESTAGKPRRERKERRALGDIDPISLGKITAIRERRAGSSRYVVEIDGRDGATISARAISELSLRIGGVVDETLADVLRDENAMVAVFDKAVELLAVRARSVRDLKLRLRRAGALSPVIDAAIERLTALGLLNDEAYARNLAHARVVGGAVSKRRIGQELQKRGVARDVADEAIDATLEDVELDEMGGARAAAAKRMRSLKSLDAPTRRRRLYAFLARRGYETAVISRVVKEVEAGRVDDEDADDGVSGSSFGTSAGNEEGDDE
jgi:regulatory protein